MGTQQARADNANKAERHDSPQYFAVLVSFQCDLLLQLLIEFDNQQGVGKDKHQPHRMLVDITQGKEHTERQNVL